jgi:histidine ammonia-lyase
MVEISNRGLGISEVVAVAREDAEVMLTRDACDAMAASAAIVQRLADSEDPVYGVSTGFGSLATTPIPADRRTDLQRSLIRSHAAGMGPPVEREVVRAMMALRARSLAMGYSGTRPELARAIVAMLNAGITPVVPEHGSLGASGDLAPLAHCALALMGEGEVFGPDGRREPAAASLGAAGLRPVVLRAKEGLALINGTDGMLGMLALATSDLERLLRVADLTAAMSVEALLGTNRAFAAELIALRPHAGQAASAANMHRLLEGSAIVASHRYDDPRVQDAYSLRCAPQVNGAARDALENGKRAAHAELAAAIDNPMILLDGRVESCGNFHGAPVAFACDFLAIAAAEVGAIAERRTDRMLDASRSQGLPPFLAEDPGVDSGLMLAQYTQAALVAENRRLAAPASVDSLPTSAMQEDHVSMGWAAARKLRVSLVETAKRLVQSGAVLNAVESSAGALL